MAKINRNDPCPCGSGKKYKKCCGASNVIPFNTNRYNEELDQLESALAAYAFNNYDETLSSTISNYLPDNPDVDQATIDAFSLGISLWYIMHVTHSNQGEKTVFDAFFTKQKPKIRLPRVSELFEQWRHTEPGIYKITAYKGDYVKAADLFSDKVFTVYEPELADDSYAIGFLLPYADYYKFLVSPLLFPEELKHITKLADDYQRNRQFVAEFPAFLGEALLAADSEDHMDISFENPVHLGVFQLFERHMQTKSASDEAINHGASLWYQYCKLKDPVIRKAGPYAAALDYLAQDIEPPRTQKELAEEYGTSASTISQNVRKIDDVFIETSLSDSDNYRV